MPKTLIERVARAVHATEPQTAYIIRMIPSVGLYVAAEIIAYINGVDPSAVTKAI